jgi:hypothetical protein
MTTLSFLLSIHWWRDDLQSRLVRGIGASSPTRTDDEKLKAGAPAPFVPVGNTTRDKRPPFVRGGVTNLDKKDHPL